jgi:MFS family permease
MSSLIMTIGVGAGPTVLGILHDVSSYRLSFFVGALSSAVAFALFAAAGPLVPYEQRARHNATHRAQPQHVRDRSRAV